MKKIRKILLFVWTLSLILCSFGCGNQAGPNSEVESEQPVEAVDHTASLKLNMASYTLKQEVTVKNFVDGDTVHFNIPSEIMEGGVLKARFLAINTPESTGKIEPYGKAASNFTKNALKEAESIIVESDSDKWNADSTGSRYLVWVWYKTAESEDYKNLNVEILQNGLAIASNSNNNIYGSICMSAIEQARSMKLNVYSGQKDPDFYDGAAVELTLKELRTNIEAYRDILVAFECVITSNSNDTVYVEQYDAETDMYYGISVYYGNSGVGGDGLQILGIGNLVRIVGRVQYYETGETWQVSGLKYRAMKPDDPENIKLISEGHQAAYMLIDEETFLNGTREIIIKDTDTGEDKIESFSFAELAMSTTVSMNDLLVQSVYTTEKDGSSSNGAMTLNCTVNGIPVSVRTSAWRDENGQLIGEEVYLGKTINVKGVVDYFDGNYQIKVFTQDQITVK